MLSKLDPPLLVGMVGAGSSEDVFYEFDPEIKQWAWFGQLAYGIWKVFSFSYIKWRLVNGKKKKNK